jgi:hypothetical protein
MALFNPRHQRFLTGENNTIDSHHTDHGERSRFQILHLGNGIVEIRTHHGKLVAVRHNGSSYTTNSHVDGDSRFHMEFYPGIVAFRTENHGRYLGIEEGGIVRGHHHLSEGEQFQELQ